MRAKETRVRTESGIILIRADDVKPKDDSVDVIRRVGVDKSVGARQLWLGRVWNEPGMQSPPHHHGEAETAGTVLRGRARILFGAKYDEYVDMEEGDFIYIPAFTNHIEMNLSKTEPLEFMTARSPDNIVVNLDGFEGH